MNKKTNKKPSVVFYGSGGHGKVIADIVRKEGSFELVGFIDDNPKRKGMRVLDIPILGGKEVLLGLFHRGINYAIVAIADNKIREEKVHLLSQYKFKFAKAIHPGAHIGSDVEIGDGSVVMAGAVINPDVKLGRHVIVNTQAVVEHDNRIGDFVHISPAAVLAGGVELGSRIQVGMGACVRQNLHVADGSMIGAGAVVVSDVAAGVTVVGIPAKVLK
jgi:sugar O-acyltransferase (sialic acid O-acetyltransferase NeuD family)